MFYLYLTGRRSSRRGPSWTSPSSSSAPSSYARRSTRKSPGWPPPGSQSQCTRSVDATGSAQL
ncbi:hypothetical protein N9M16_05145 [Candidatus Dependentiae bacterium]|nr:hypothetical protein [Candidatus Dependentiae bacterium]